MSTKDLASTSTHCDYYEKAVSICNCIVDECSWHLAIRRMDVTSMVSNNIADVPRFVPSSDMEVLAMHTNFCGQQCSVKQSPYSVLGTDHVALELVRVLADHRKVIGSSSSDSAAMTEVMAGTYPELDVAHASTVKVRSVGDAAGTT